MDSLTSREIDQPVIISEAGVHETRPVANLTAPSRDSHDRSRVLYTAVPLMFALRRW